MPAYHSPTAGEDRTSESYNRRIGIPLQTLASMRNSGPGRGPGKSPVAVLVRLWPSAALCTPAGPQWDGMTRQKLQLSASYQLNALQYTSHIHTCVLLDIPAFLWIWVSELSRHQLFDEVLTVVILPNYPFFSFF